VCLGLCGRAAAEPQRTVAVVRSAGPEALADHLRDEMMTLGWSVVELTPPRPKDGRPIDIRAVTQAISGSAGILVRRREIVVWIESAHGDGTALEETVPLAIDMDPSLAAMQLVELLRARLIAAGFELRPAPAAEPMASSDAPAASPPEQTRAEEPTQPPEAGAPPEADRAPAPATIEPPPKGTLPPEPLWLGAGPGLGISAGGVPLSAAAWLRGWTRPTERVAAGLDVTLPIAGSRVTAGVAEATVHTAWALAGLDYVAIQHDGAARLLLGLAAGLALVRVAGAAPPPDTTRSVWIPAGAFAAHARYRHPVGGRFVLTAEVLLGATAPRPVVRFYDGVAASWGRPFAFLAFGAEARML
jgi:hypothetical protein